MTGSGRRLQNAVRVPIDRTTSLLAQQLESKTAQFSIPINKQKPVHNQTLPSNHTPAPDNYLPSNPYPPYPPVNGTSNPSHAGGSHHVYLPPPKPNVPSQSTPAYQNAPQYPYPHSYVDNNSTYSSPPYPSTNDLPTTAAAANAFLNNYPPQPPPPNQPFLNTNAPAYNSYHSPGSPTSWRNWAGNVATNLEVRLCGCNQTLLPPLPGF